MRIADSRIEDRDYRELLARDPSFLGSFFAGVKSTPLGPMFACASTKGLCLLEFVDRRMLEAEFEDLQRRLGARILAGERTEFTVPCTHPAPRSRCACGMRCARFLVVALRAVVARARAENRLLT